ncbi:autophagy protein Apg6-domain-containing protein [Globomyces pollinis-pini]|nr:autophagy protein Apg6-domain-containing protein [Globomyces pollinis-pini]
MSFFCQCCGQSIHLSPSLLSSNIIKSDLDSFIILDGDQRAHLSSRLTIANRLFSIISNHSNLNHPMCDDCANELLFKLDSNLLALQKESILYDNHLQSIINNNHTNSNLLASLPDSPTDTDLALNSLSINDITKTTPTTHTTTSQKDIDQLIEKEKKASQLLNSLDQEHQSLTNSLIAIQSELADLENQEQEYWKSLNVLQMDSLLHQQDLVSVNLLFEFAHSRLDTLAKTNVFNDAFRIWHDGLRLGRLPNKMVEWPEINAAIGQGISYQNTKPKVIHSSESTIVALLLDTIANRIPFTFKQYQIIPCGSFSKIQKLDGDKSTHELYGSSDLTGLLFWNRRFDTALVALLQCLHQLGDHAESLDPRYKLPYRIHKDRIGDCSIRMQFNQDEGWTKALKYMLIDVKWMLAFCCSQTS